MSPHEHVEAIRRLMEDGLLLPGSVVKDRINADRARERYKLRLAVHDALGALRSTFCRSMNDESIRRSYVVACEAITRYVDKGGNPAVFRDWSMISARPYLDIT